MWPTSAWFRTKHHWREAVPAAVQAQWAAGALPLVRPVMLSFAIEETGTSAALAVWQRFELTMTMGQGRSFTRACVQACEMARVRVCGFECLYGHRFCSVPVQYGSPKSSQHWRILCTSWLSYALPSSRATPPIDVRVRVRYGTSLCLHGAGLRGATSCRVTP